MLAVLAIAVPIANLAIPDGSPLHVSTFSVQLLGKYLCYALLAISLDLVWGYAGILSLGHGAFFALGGYAMGMYLMRQIGARGVYGNPELPDFMVFLNWDALPWYWYGFDQFWFAMLMVVLAPGVLAFVFGWLAFRSRVTGVYLSIITQALTYALMLAFFRNEMGFGGNNGLTDFKDILGFNLQSDTTRIALFLCSVVALALGYLVCRYVVTSKLGRVVAAIRDAESRVRFTGFRAETYKLWVFTLSAILAGIAGALYVPQVGIINPNEFQPLNSIELVVWVALGGRGTLYGAALGAAIVNYAKSTLTARAARSLAVRARRAVRPRDDCAAEGLRRHRGALAEAAPCMRRTPPRAETSRAAAAGRHRRAAQLDPVPRQDLGQLRRLPRAEQLESLHRARRAALRDRAERRRQDDDDGRHHRQDAPRRRQGVLRGHGRSARARRARDRELDRPQVPEADGVREPYGAREPRARGHARQARVAGAHEAARRPRSATASTRRCARSASLEHAQRPAGALSHGQKQWLEIGMLLMQNPQVLLVDEPVAGMTKQETETTAELLTGLAGEHSVVVVEHDMEFVRSIARKVTVLHEGHVLAEGPMDAIQNDARVVEVYLGE